ncbi:unnamed protein product [Chironomus riparius]|uniref:Uncharacterized protein n=1 Tax=Chironomus riparius TaxID=315576 RepID=A0A9N9S679_9DIPT|nr:unnamed protein product [Chironomus riparius]
MKKFLLIFGIATFAVHSIVSENDDEAGIEQSQMEAIDDDISNPQDITKPDNQQFSIHKDNNDTENDKIPSTKEHEDRLKLLNDHDDDKEASGDDATLTTDNEGNDDAVNEAENDNGYDTNDQSQDEGIIGVENDEEDDKMDGSGDEDDKEEKVEQDEEENLNVGDENEEEQKSSSGHDENEEVEEEMESGNAGGEELFIKGQFVDCSKEN